MATGTISRGMVLLWTNSNPSSNFAAQMVPLDLSTYDAVIIQADYKAGASSPWRANTFAPIDGSNCQLLMIGNMTSTSQAAIMVTRYFDVLTTGINFESATKKSTNATSSSTDNSNAIPTKIWGVRFG